MNNSHGYKSFVRLDSNVRDRLRAFCDKHGLLMSALVSRVLNEYLSARGFPPIAPKRKAAK